MVTPEVAICFGYRDRHGKQNENIKLKFQQDASWVITSSEFNFWSTFMIKVCFLFKNEWSKCPWSPSPGRTVTDKEWLLRKGELLSFRDVVPCVSQWPHTSVQMTCTNWTQKVISNNNWHRTIWGWGKDSAQGEDRKEVIINRCD